MPNPSNRPGMGSIPFSGGTTFRVWAPFAQDVATVFYDQVDQQNDHPTNSASLASEGNGYWSVDVANVNVGQLYRYRIQSAASNATLYKLDPYAKSVTHSVGKARVVSSDFPWTDQGFRMHPFNHLVVYELHIGSFDDDPGDRPGNLTRARSRLSDLSELGVNCVHVMAPTEFARDFSWGYNVALPFAIESAYGGLEGFKRFVDRAHELGIAVLAGTVFNHYGPDDLGDGLWRFDGWQENGFGGVYFYNDVRAATPGWGEKNRPDFGRPEVRQYIRDHVEFLLGECHCDGVRIDSTCNVWALWNGQGWNPDGADLLRLLANDKNSRHLYPLNKIFIAEDWHYGEGLTRPTDQGGLGMDAEWDGFVHDVRPILESPSDDARDLSKIAEALVRKRNGDAFKRVVYTESHDETANGKPRLNTTIDPSNPESWFARKRSALGAILSFTAPGIPMLWQGQELLETDFFHDENPLDWSRKEQFPGVFALYQRLARIRRNWENNTRGLMGQHVNVYWVDQTAKILAYHRWSEGGPGDDVVVILNLANRLWDSYWLDMPREGLWQCRFSSDSQFYGPDYGNFGGHPTRAVSGGRSLGFAAEFSIAPYTGLIYSQ